VAKLEALQAQQELEAARSTLRSREVEAENRELTARAALRCAALACAFTRAHTRNPPTSTEMRTRANNVQAHSQHTPAPLLTGPRAVLGCKEGVCGEVTCERLPLLPAATAGRVLFHQLLGAPE
jgi:hypothetical protein